MPSKPLIPLAGIAMFAAFAASAGGGTLQGGAWKSNCTNLPGEPPQFSETSKAAYTASLKEVNAWQVKAKAYADCLSNDAHTDLAAIQAFTNQQIGVLNQQSAAITAASQAAVEKLNAPKPKLDK